MFEKKVGELLYFISEVAISARMNTAYNRRSLDNPDTPKAAMWLVDMLHNFHGIGFALTSGDRDKAVEEIGRLQRIWTANQTNIESSLEVNGHGQSWSVDQGISLLEELKLALMER